MMDDDGAGVVPVNTSVLPSRSVPEAAPPTASGGGTMIDPAVQRIPDALPSFTEVVGKRGTKDNASIPKPASQVIPGVGTPVQPAVVVPASTPQAAKPKMSRKKKIIIAAAGLAGIAGVATAASLLRKGGEEDGSAFLDEGSTGENLFGGLSGTCMQGDGLSFSDAFANAREELGANGVFKWRGQLYGTMLKDEWDGLSDEGKSEFSQQAQSVELENDIPESEADTASDESITVMDVEEIDPVEEGEPVDEVIEEGEPVDEDIEEGEPVDEAIEEGEPVDEEIEGGESVDDETEEFDTYNDEEDYADYMNDEDPSDFV